jgi:hypothetical protein
MRLGILPDVPGNESLRRNRVADAFHEWVSGHYRSAVGSPLPAVWYHIPLIIRRTQGYWLKLRATLPSIIFSDHANKAGESSVKHPQAPRREPT